MTANILATADALSDKDLLARIPVLAGREREAATELIAHLAVLDTRPVLYAAKGYGSLFRYCTDALGLRREVPDGDLGVIFDQAITLLLDRLEKTKLGRADRPRSRPLIRPETDKEARTATRPSRNIPREGAGSVRQEVSSPLVK